MPRKGREAALESGSCLRKGGADFCTGSSQDLFQSGSSLTLWLSRRLVHGKGREAALGLGLVFATPERTSACLRNARADFSARGHRRAVAGRFFNPAILLHCRLQSGLERARAGLNLSCGLLSFTCMFGTRGVQACGHHSWDIA